MYKPEYPCDVPDAMGEFHCPYGAEFNSSGYACRNHCGLGVDTDSITEEPICQNCFEEDANGDDGLCQNCREALDDNFIEPDIDESINPYDGTYDWENDCTMIDAEDW